MARYVTLDLHSPLIVLACSLEQPTGVSASLYVSCVALYVFMHDASSKMSSELLAGHLLCDSG